MGFCAAGYCALKPQNEHVMVSMGTEGGSSTTGPPFTSGVCDLPFEEGCDLPSLTEVFFFEEAGGDAAFFVSSSAGAAAAGSSFFLSLSKISLLARSAAVAPKEDPNEVNPAVMPLSTPSPSALPQLSSLSPRAVSRAD